MLGSPLPNLNLIKPIRPERAALPAGFYQSIILDLFGVSGAAAVGYTYRLFLSQNASFLAVLAALAAFSFFSLFQVFLTKNVWRRFLVLFFQVLAFLVFFSYLELWYLGLIAAVTLVLFFWGELLSRSELGSNLEVKFFKTARHFLKKFMTAVILAGLLLYLPQWDAQKSFFSPESFEVLYDWASGLTSNLYPEIRFDATVGKFAESVARLELRNNQTFRGLAPAAQERAVRDGSSQVLANLSKFLKIEVSSEEPLVAAFYRFIKNTYGNLEQQFRPQFKIGWAVVVFLILRSIGASFYFLIAGLTFFVYQLLLALNIVRVVGESRMHEVLEFS